MKSKISIIVPVYNVERYLSQCLDSLVNQTYQNIEILCVNDGSTDGSLEILKRYEANDQRVSVLQKENGGLSSARNFAHQFVTGNYIMYVDSDDWIELDTCEKSVKVAVEADADVVFWNYVREFTKESKPKYIWGADKKTFRSEEELKSLHRRFLGLYREETCYPENADSIVTAWGKLYRASLILDNKVEFIDTKIIGTEDALFNLYVFGYVNSAVYIPDCLNHYRKNNDSSLTSTYKSKLRKQWQQLYAYMQEYIDDFHLDTAFQEALNNRISFSLIGLGLNVVGADNLPHKIREIKEIIASEEYRKAVKRLELRYLPFHWKVFYGFAKQGNAVGVYLLLKIMHKIVSG